MIVTTQSSSPKTPNTTVTMPSSYASSLIFPSTPSLVSVNTTTSTSSTTPLRHASSPSSSLCSFSPSSSSQPVPKDYSKSFGLLQSQYGWGPMTSVPTPVRSRKEDRETKKNRRKDSDSRSSSVQKEQEVEQQSESGGKDYQTVFGSLSSRYGFGGGWPMPSKMSKEHRG